MSRTQPQPLNSPVSLADADVPWKLKKHIADEYFLEPTWLLIWRSRASILHRIAGSDFMCDRFILYSEESGNYLLVLVETHPFDADGEVLLDTIITHQMLGAIDFNSPKSRWLREQKRKT